MKFRFGIRSLLVACTLVAAFFPFRAAYDHWFRSKYSGFHIHKILGEWVQDGDSFDLVSQQFDRSEARSEHWMRENMHYFANRKPIWDDLKTGDEYYSFFINGGSVSALFQFRNGVVVNHRNAIYKGPYSQVRHYKDVSPNSLFRHGALPVYTLMVALLGAVTLLVMRFTNRQRRYAR